MPVAEWEPVIEVPDHLSHTGTMLATVPSESGEPVTPLDPWAAETSKSAWFRNLAGSIRAWQPDVRLALDAAAIRTRLEAMIEREEAWGYHPCLSALTSAAPDRRLQRDFQLSVWVAATGDTDLGVARIPEPLWAWAPDGGQPVPAGVVVLADIGADVRTAEDDPTKPSRIALDIWGDAAGLDHPDGWATETFGPEQRQTLQAELIRFLRTMRWFRDLLPTCAGWVEQVTRVAVPLAGRGRPSIRSESWRDVPGQVALDLYCAPVDVLEALIHESAHLHFFLVEAAGPLVDPSYAGQHWSPLRKTPRPLRGIFLAHHALAHIYRFYRDVLETSLADEAVAAEHNRLRTMLASCEQTLTTAQEHLTPAGVQLFEQTVQATGNDRR
jgi:hypothetical protein